MKPLYDPETIGINSAAPGWKFFATIEDKDVWIDAEDEPEGNWLVQYGPGEGDYRVYRRGEGRRKHPTIYIALQLAGYLR